MMAVSVLKARFWLVLFLFSFSVESKVISSSPFVDDGGNGEIDGEKIQTKKFLRKGYSYSAAKIDISATPSEHERKLAAGARLIARYNSNRGYQFARKCAIEIISDIDETRVDEIKDDDVNEEGGSYTNTSSHTLEDRTGEIIFIADEDCMLFLKRQRRDVMWVDYDHPTKLLDYGGGKYWLEWWLDSLTSSSDGKSYSNFNHNYHDSTTNTNQRERNLQEDYSEWAMSLIQANVVNKGNRDTKICIVDTGINLSHPAFDGVPITGENNERWSWDRDTNGHGTLVAGVIAGFSKYVTGGSGRIQLHITRGSGDDGQGYEFELYIAIQQCIKAGVDVINISLGSNFLSSLNDSLYHQIANEHGILLIAASGNDGDGTKHYPAAHPAGIAVSSVNQNGEWSSFSNKGNFIELAGPGAAINGPTFGKSYTSRSGTSLASPFVAGAAAILRTHYDPKICPSVALRYALAINAVVPGAPTTTGINGNDMKSLDQFPGMTRRDDNLDSFAFFASAGYGDNYVQGKCNNQYGNGIIKTRDALNWLRHYDCFSPVLSIIQDTKNKGVAPSSRTVPPWFSVNQGEGDDESGDGDGDFVFDSARLMTWAPIIDQRIEEEEDDDDDLERPVTMITSSYEDTIDGSSSEIESEYDSDVNEATIDGSSSEIESESEYDNDVNEAMYIMSLEKMLPWYERRGGGCYSG